MTHALAELRAADEGRTPGPWRSRVSSMMRRDPGETSPRRIPIVSAGTDDNAIAIVDSDFDHEQETADFIALCGTHMPTILARLDAAEAALEASEEHQRALNAYARAHFPTTGPARSYVDATMLAKADALAKWEGLTRG